MFTSNCYNAVFIGSFRTNVTRIIRDKDLLNALKGKLGPGDFCYVPDNCIPPGISMFID